MEQRNSVFASLKQWIPEQKYGIAMSRLLSLADLGVMVLQIVTAGVQAFDTRFHSVYTLAEDDVKRIAEKVENIVMSARMVFDNVHTMTVIDSVRSSLVAARDGEGPPLDAAELDRYTDILRSIKVDDTLALPQAVESYEIDPRAAAFTHALADDRMPRNLRDLADSAYTLEAALDSDAAGALAERIGASALKFIVYHTCDGDADFARFVQHGYVARVASVVPDTRVYRINYGQMLSKWRGETEKRFQAAADWFTRKAAANHVAGHGFDVLIFENVEALMGRRGGGDDPEHLVTIKNSMLQIMDNFNKNAALSRFGLIFTSGAAAESVDSAFMRRVTTVLVSKPLHSPEMDAVKLESIKYLLDASRLNVNGVDSEPIVSLRRARSQGAIERAVADLYIKFSVSLARGVYVLDEGVASNVLNAWQRYYNLLGEEVDVASSPKLSVVVGEGSRYGTGGKKVRYHRSQDPLNLSPAAAKRTVFISENGIIG